jgi:hypothetical protein
MNSTKSNFQPLPTSTKNTPIVLKMSTTSASTRSPSPFSLLNFPNSPTQSIATPRLYDYCYQVETNRQSDSITSYNVNINPSSDNELPPNDIECINDRLHERTDGKAWLAYDYLSCLAGNALYQLAQDAHKTNADIHVQIMRSDEDPNQLHANVIKAWGEHRRIPAKPASLDEDILSDAADADGESSSLPSLEAMSILDTPAPRRPDSPYPFPSVVQAQQVLTYEEQANRLISIARMSNDDTSGCDAERGTYPYCCAFHHHRFTAYRENALVTYAPKPSTPSTTSSDLPCEWTRNLRASRPATPPSPPGFTVKKPSRDSLRSCWHCHQLGHKKSECPERNQPRKRVHYLRDRRNVARRSAGPLKMSKTRRIERSEVVEIYKTVQNHATWVDHSDPDSVIRAGVHKRIQEFLIDML